MQTYISKIFLSIHLKEEHILTSVLASIAARTRRNKHDQMPTHPYTGRNGTMAWVVTCKQKHKTSIIVQHASSHIWSPMSNFMNREEEFRNQLH